MERISKLQRPQEREIRSCEQAVDAVQGCGRVGCPICMPRGGGGGGRMGGGDMTAEDVLRREMVKMASIMGAPPDFFFTSFRGGPVYTSAQAARSDPESERRATLERESNEARKKVEKYLLKTEHAVAWDDVVGNEAARTALIEAVEAPTRNAELYAHYGVRPPKGALLFGPPGCGKTMFAKAASAVLRQLHGGRGGEMLTVNGPQIQSPYVGVTEEIIRDIFTYARAYKALHGQPLVVFVDECDAILPCRDGSATGRRALPWEESNVATFLTEMDGMEESGAFVMLATNRPDAIDPALLRDGRCDRRIRVERPGCYQAAVMIERLLRKLPLSGLGAAEMAVATADGLFSRDHRLAVIHHADGEQDIVLGDTASGAQVVGLVERAKGIAMRRDLASGGAPSGLTLDDLERATAEVLHEARAMPVPVAVAREVADRHGVAVERVEPFGSGRTRGERKTFSDAEIAEMMAAEAGGP